MNASYRHLSHEHLLRHLNMETLFSGGKKLQLIEVHPLCLQFGEEHLKLRNGLLYVRSVEINVERTLPAKTTKVFGS